LNRRQSPCNNRGQHLDRWLRLEERWLRLQAWWLRLEARWLRLERHLDGR